MEKPITFWLHKIKFNFFFHLFDRLIHLLTPTKSEALSFMKIELINLIFCSDPLCYWWEQACSFIEILFWTFQHKNLLLKFYFVTQVMKFDCLNVCIRFDIFGLIIQTYFWFLLVFVIQLMPLNLQL